MPDSAYPEGTILYWTVDGKIYRNRQTGTSASDNFNRASLDANWTSQPGEGGTLEIYSSSVVRAHDGTDAYSYRNAESYGNDQYSQVTMKNVANWQDDGGCTVRCSNSQATFYRFTWLPAYIQLLGPVEEDQRNDDGPYYHGIRASVGRQRNEDRRFRDDD